MTPSFKDTEFFDLVYDLAEERLSPERSSRLEELLRTDSSLHRKYVDFMLIVGGLHRIRGEGKRIGDLEIRRCEDLPQDVGPAVEPPGRLEAGAPPSSFILHPSSLSPLFVGGPVFSYMVATIIVGMMLLGAWAYTVSHVQNCNYANKNSRGLTAPGDSVSKPPDLLFIGRVTGMNDCRWADPRTETYIGASVPINRKYALSSGLMEITYKTGAKVILEGPCAYEVESDAGGFLSLGKLTARVDSAKPQAVKTQDPRPKTQDQNPKSPNLQISKFTVRTPTAVVTDLGTEFGVEVNDEGTTTSHVFQGKVNVHLLGGDGKQKDVVLQANESARVEKDGRVRETHRTPGEKTDLVRFTHPTTPPMFVREMPKRTPIKVFNTGVGLKEGDEDPHWRIVARGDQPDFKPRPAVVTRVPASPDFMPNDAAGSQWISTADDMPNLPHEVAYTFRTTFVLSGATPGLTILHGKYVVDNHIEAIRLNGRSVEVPLHGDNGPFDILRPFTIRDGFVEGLNVLEIDVYNGRQFHEIYAESAMMLRVELSGSMLPQWRKAANTPERDTAAPSRKGGRPTNKP